ncbi:MAG TPA: ribonuclease HI family protein [candidate division Zixibacteria bacterium]|nr:ribonuclease HI family protein [candidate division Zixibacteria bacterium]
MLAHIDGGARGNPGPAGYGAYLQDQDGRVLAELSEFLGAQTNNFAEYSGLVAALEYAIKHGFRAVKVISDSELLVKQIKGQYKVRSESLLPIYEEAKALIKQLEAFQIKHVLRHLNKDADRLANEAMDRGMKTARNDRADAYAKPPAQNSGRSNSAAVKEVRGFVRNGVVEFTGDALPDGIFVYVRPARKD